jgi:hypothetical protein
MLTRRSALNQRVVKAAADWLSKVSANSQPRGNQVRES